MIRRVYAAGRGAQAARLGWGLALALWLAAAPLHAAPICHGDCDGDGAVTVDEILVGVQIALGNRQLSDCLDLDIDADGRVTVDELITALGFALVGCPIDRDPIAVDRPVAGVLELASAVPVAFRFDNQTRPLDVRATVDGAAVTLAIDAESGEGSGVASGLAGGRHTLVVEIDYGNGSQRAEVAFDAIALDHPDECEILNAASCLLPYPSSRFLAPAATATGFRLAFPQVGMPAQRGVRLPVAPYQRLDGFSPTVGISMHFPQRVDLEASNASRLLAETRTHDLRSLDLDSPTLLLDAETGERVLHFVEIDVRAATNGFPERELVIMNPAASLTPGRRYIVAVRDLVDRDGNPLQAEPAFAALRDGTPSHIAALGARRLSMELLFQRLESFGVPRSNLLLAFDFVVASDDSLTGEMVAMRDETFAWLDGLGEEVTFTVDRIVEADCSTPGERVWRLVEGRFAVPLYLTADPLVRPDLPSTLRRDTADMPQAEGFTHPPYTIALPCALLAEEEPLVHPVVLGHGLFGDGRGFVNQLTRTTEIEAFDYIAGATDWTGLAALDSGGGDNIPTSFVGRVALDQPRNFPALPDRLRQGQLNTLVLARMMKEGRLNQDPAFQLPDGRGAFPGSDAEQFYFGASLGGIMGLMFAALSPDVTNVVVNVPGINFSLLLPRSIAFIVFEVAIRATGVLDPIDQRLLLVLTHELWARGEAAGYATHVTENPLPGTAAKRVLMTAAIHDQLVTNQATELAARTLGLPSLVGSVLPNLPAIPDLEGPLPSALVFYDAGSFDPENPLHAPFIPPLENIPPEVNRCDPHGRQAFIPAAIVQLFEFLRPGGEVVNFCDGLCDASDPFELPFGGQRPCHPL